MALSHVFVRGVHVLAMAVALGGSISLWWAIRTRAPLPAERAALLRFAEGYEWLFWAALGTLVMTGVGNLGALAPAVPTTTTQWGLVLYVKLVAVLGLLLLSAVRTVVVHKLSEADTSVNVAASLSRAYAVTMLYLVGLLALAEVLAHG
ncbi:CopD family protein [Haladaptatus sp. DJG-WS-42]|uniref:CopD family protein n=1 Tax=Haladaptatus sp. DJG-WS-42 TaxID=3120516 RepID=UPI0030CB011D